MNSIGVNTLLVLILGLGIGESVAYVLIISQSAAEEGYILFDAKINQDGGDTELIRTNSNHSYRVSHHKTQPWVHRLVHFDKGGKLRLKRSLDSCFHESTYSMNSFLVYIDIIAQQFHNNAIPTGTFVPSPVAYPFDYISFPLLIIIQPSPECSLSQVQTQGPFAEIKAQDKEILHWVRSVDDIYVSVPVQGDFCHHASEKIGNIHDFMPNTVSAQCRISASSGDHFFGVESKTNDIALKIDFCLFEAFHTSEILLRLECFPNKQEPQHLVSWDQLVHFIIHRLGPSSLKSGNTLDESHFERHPIHRIRREMRNQAPFFDHSLYKATVPEEQEAGLTVTTIVASDPENSPITYSMTSLLDSRSQQFFSLDPKSGIVTTTEKLDREKMDNHYFRIVASDAGIPPRTGTAILEASFKF